MLQFFEKMENFPNASSVGALRTANSSDGWGLCLQNLGFAKNGRQKKFAKDFFLQTPVAVLSTCFKVLSSTNTPHLLSYFILT